MKDPVRGVFTLVDWYFPHPGRTPMQTTLTGFVEAPGIARAPAEVRERAGRSARLQQLPITIDRAAPSDFVVEWREVPKTDGGSADARRAAQEAADSET